MIESGVGAVTTEAPTEEPSIFLILANPTRVLLKSAISPPASQCPWFFPFFK
jgi:hypothetical protein